ncbi:MAG: hypothetical protein WA738_13270 [Candidatus Angelobacter sp.]
MQRSVFAAAACASSPLLALGGGKHSALMTGDVSDGTESLAPSLTPSLPNQSDNWQDHARALDSLGRNMFTSAVGTNFKVFLANAAPVWMTLMAVEDLPPMAPANPGSFAVSPKSHSVAPPASGFVLVFGGSSPVSSATYLLEHANLGRFALFLVPAGNGQQVYTAVVNRLDNPTIVAVPFSAGQAPVKMNAAPATSSGNETPSRALSETPGARKGALRD